MRIGVFDSGIGGLSVAQAIEKAFPQHEVVYRHDTPAHFPYARKSPGELYEYALPVMRTLADEDACAVIVVACNTVSTTLMERLRTEFDIPLVATEPMIKPATTLTKTGVIAVCATPATLASLRYRELKEKYAKNIQIIEPDCADWSSLIEYGTMTHDKIRADIEPALEQGADVIVLGCTHYHWIAEDIDMLCAGEACVIHPEALLVERVKALLGDSSAVYASAGQ